MADRTEVLFDVNALVALSLATHQHHRAAHEFLDRTSAWATCAMTEASLYRLLLNPTVVGRAIDATDIGRVVGGFRRDSRWRLIPDATTLADPRVETSVLMGHQQVTDLHLVNLAAASNVRLATFDAAIPTWLAPADRRHVVIIPS